MLSVLGWRQYRRHTWRRCRLSPQSPQHMLGTSAGPPKALIPTHTGRIHLCRQRTRVHTAGTLSCLRSAGCRRHMQHTCRPSLQSHPRSSGTQPDCCQAPGPVHIHRSCHQCQRTLSGMPHTKYGLYSAAYPQHTVRTGRQYRRSQQHSSHTLSCLRLAYFHLHT